MTSPLQTGENFPATQNCETCPFQNKAKLEQEKFELSGNDDVVVIWKEAADRALESCEAGEPTTTKQRNPLDFGRIVTGLNCATSAPHLLREEFFTKITANVI